MRLKLVRTEFYRSNTIGRLYIDGVFECFTLEDAVRKGPKVYGQTAIPEGEYCITLDFSPRFQRILPRLYHVPNFEGVLIHTGNKAEQTEGCILVGRSEKDAYIEESKLAFASLMKKLEQQKGDILIQIVNDDDARFDMQNRVVEDPR